jgi:hypothetical protein
MMRVVLVMALATVGCLGWAAPSQAAPITYEMTSVASGTLGGTAFTNALVTLTLTGDTSGVEPWFIPGALRNIGTATVSVAAVGTATLNDPNGYMAGVAPVGTGTGMGIFEFDNAARTSFTHIFVIPDHAGLTGYNLVGPLGPLTGTGGGLATQPGGSPVSFSTTAGALRMTGGGDPVTVTVRVAAVPEPASLSLIAIGALGAIAARRRRQRGDS